MKPRGTWGPIGQCMWSCVTAAVEPGNKAASGQGEAIWAARPSRCLRRGEAATASRWLWWGEREWRGWLRWGWQGAAWPRVGNMHSGFQQARQGHTNHLCDQNNGTKIDSIFLKNKTRHWNFDAVAKLILTQKFRWQILKNELIIFQWLNFGVKMVAN